MIRSIGKKSLIANSFFNVCYQLLNVLFPLVTSAYVSRILMPEGIGKVAIAQNWAQYFVVFAALGIPNYGIREIARSRVNPKNLERTFSELWVLNAVSTSVSICSYIFFICISGKVHNNYPLYLVVGLSILFNYLNIDWFYQGIEEYKYIAIRSFIIKCISLASIFIFIRNANDYSIYALISALAIGGNNIFNWFHLNNLNIRLSFIEIHPLKHLKSVLLLFSTTVSIQLYTLLITTFLGALSSESSVGYYSNTMKIVRMLITVIAALGSTLLPRLSVYRMKGEEAKAYFAINRVFEVLFFLFMPVWSGLILIAKPLIIVFFGSQYLPAVPTMRIAAFLILALGFSNLFGTQVLVTYSKEKILLRCTVLGAIVCVFLCFLLIPKYHENGAALASVISEFVVTISTFYNAKHIVLFSPRKETILKSILGVMAMSTIVLLLTLLINNPFIELFLSIILGAICYFGIELIIKNPILVDFLAKI